MEHKQLSKEISWLSLPLIFLIILLHCYSTVSIPGNHATYFKLVYPFSLWLGETGVPGFFFISGFLFFLSQKSYKNKLKTRINTLLIPYILWNGILTLAYLASYFLGYPQDINGKNVSEYDLVDYARLFWDRGSYDNGNFVPILCPLWYIRNLLIMSVLSPVFYYLIKYSGELFLAAIAIWWMTTYHNAFIQQTVLFFCLGAYFSIHKIDPLRHTIRFKTLFLMLCIVFALGDIFTHTIYSISINLQIHRLALLFNIPTMLLIANYCTKKGLSSSTLSNSAFIVFATHYPIVVVLRKFCASQFANSSDLTHVLLYWACVLIATISSIGVYIILNKYFPKTKNILSGRR